MLILDRTFDSAVNVAAARYTIFPVRLLMRNQFDSLSRLKSFKGKVIQFHGTIDRVIPVEHAKALHQAIETKDKTLIELPDLGHMDGVPDSILKQIAQLIGDQ